MSIYTILLFLHVSGDIGLFIGLGTQLISLAALRRVNGPEQARAIAGLLAIADPIGVVSALLTIASGLYMAITVWGLHTSWIAAALGSIILFIAPVIGLVLEPRTRAIVSATRQAPDGPLPGSFYAHTNDPVLGTALQTMVFLLLGIVFLMTNKPAWAGAVITIVIALLTGLVSSAPLWWRGSGRMKSRSEEMD
jgi:hypothetical protein